MCTSIHFWQPQMGPAKKGNTLGLLHWVAIAFAKTYEYKSLIARSPEFDSDINPGHFCVECAYYPPLCMGFFWVLPFPPIVLGHATG